MIDKLILLIILLIQKCAMLSMDLEAVLAVVLAVIPIRFKACSCM